MSITQSPPAETRRVRITAADFNGHDWDGSPFSETTTWLMAAIKAERIKPVAADRDYALFDVTTDDGVIRAEPRDEIRLRSRTQNTLEVWRMQQVFPDELDTADAPTPREAGAR